MIYNILANLKTPSVYHWLEKWDIHIWGLEDTNIQFFEHVKTTSGAKINPNMASGVCGKYRIDLYLKDSDNSFVTRENSDRVQHEICHAKLYGTPDFVSGVHDNVSNRFFAIFWYWNKWRFSKMQLSIIDIRKFLQRV